MPSFQPERGEGQKAWFQSLPASTLVVLSSVSYILCSLGQDLGYNILLAFGGNEDLCE